jgi:diguanylate cyclase (GGDEF)-like protein
MNAILDALDCGLLLLGPDGRIRQVNRWLQERCRGARLEAGTALADAFGDAVEPRLLKAAQDCLAHGNAVRLSQAFHPSPLPLFDPHESGEERLRQAVDVVVVEDPLSRERQGLVQVRDVSESVRREQTLREQATTLSSELLKLSMAQFEIERQSLRFSEMARLAPVGLFETTGEGRVSFSNARATEQLGLDVTAFHGRRWTELLAAAGHAVEPAMAASERPAFEIALDRGTGKTWLRLEATPLQAPGQPLIGHLFTLVDVTDLREQARRNELRANHDGLTGLANRARFESQLQDLVERCRRQQRHAHVLFIDLDRFKAVNDTLGHQAGDEVLKAAAARLRRCVRGEDVVARLGGDEFAVLLDGVADETVLLRVSAKIERALKAPVATGRGVAEVGASIGWSAIDGTTVSAAAVLASADEAMYRVKRARQQARTPLQPA